MATPAALQRTRTVLEACAALGFIHAGVCSARPTEYEAEYRAWIAAGKHGSMAYLERNSALRVDPRKMLPGARSIIMVADLYWRGTDCVGPAARSDRGEASRGRIARYAQGRDYHNVIRKRLHALCDDLRACFPGERFRSFVDTAPVLEREHAARAGLGWIGKHTLLINVKTGSYLFLGGALTTLDLPPVPEQRVETDHCGSCTRCIDACPTNAITPYSVDARRCIAYLTIEQRESIDPSLYKDMGDWIFGCDICQEVCPHNRPRETGQHTPNEAYTPARDGFDLLEILGWKEPDRRAAFATTALKRATLAMMQRNAIIAAGNALEREPNETLRSRVEEVASDANTDAMVRATAREHLPT